MKDGVGVIAARDVAQEIGDREGGRIAQHQDIDVAEIGFETDGGVLREGAGGKDSQIKDKTLKHVLHPM